MNQKQKILLSGLGVILLIGLVYLLINQSIKKSEIENGEEMSQEEMEAIWAIEHETRESVDELRMKLMDLMHEITILHERVAIEEEEEMQLKAVWFGIEEDLADAESLWSEGEITKEELEERMKDVEEDLNELKLKVENY